MSWLFEGPFHQSHLRDYNMCPKMFELKYRYGVEPETRSIGLVNGSAMHKAIERVHKDSLFDMDDYYGLYRDCFAETEKSEDTPIRWKTERSADIDSLALDGSEILSHYAARAHNQQCEVLLSEAPFKVKIADYDFQGTIDQVRRQHGGIVLIDFKSGKNKPMALVLRIGLQFSVYAHGLVSGEFENGRNGLPEQVPDQVVHYQLHDHLPYKKNCRWGKAGDERGPAWYATERSELDLEASTAEVKRICGNIRRGTFPRVAQDMICKMCRYQDACLEDYLHGGLDENLVRKLRITLAEEEE